MLLVAGGAVAQSGATGRIEYLEGFVEVNGSLVDIGGTVQSGDIIRTDAGAYAEIVFNRRNIFRIGESTRAVLRLGGERPGIDLNQGSFTAVFERLRRIGGDNADFEVRTPTAVGGVRGTSFFVKVEGPDSTYVCACNGELQVPFEETTSLNILGTHHRAYRFVQGADGVVASSAELVYHGDEDLDTLAEKIDHTIPWGE